MFIFIGSNTPSRPNTPGVCQQRYGSYPSGDRQVIGSYEGNPNPANRSQSGPQYRPSSSMLYLIIYTIVDVHMKIIQLIKSYKIFNNVAWAMHHFDVFLRIDFP